MKKILPLLSIVFLIFIFGCLTFETIEIRIVFNENSSNQGKIDVIYSGIASTEEGLEKRQKDFEELIQLLEDDQFLLDQLTEGVYVKNRKLYEEHGKIIGKYSGIFANLKFDDNALKTANDEFLFMINRDQTVIETNGKIVKSDNNVFISWPMSQKELYWKVKMKGDSKTNSLLEMFRQWKEDKH